MATEKGGRKGSAEVKGSKGKGKGKGGKGRDRGRGKVDLGCCLDTLNPYGRPGDKSFYFGTQP